MNLDSPVNFQFDEYTVSKFADFEITAKVLSKENYYLGRGADLSPVDLALGWGKMSDESVLDDVKITQSGRFYYWRVESFPIPRKEIETHSANMHLVPANDLVKRTLKQVRKGEIVRISGSLINIKADDGWYWPSSKTRNDVGNGACELIWVESIYIIQKE